MKNLFVSILIIPLSLIMNAQDLNLEIEKQDVLCFGESTGSATAIVTGGVAPYNYLWSDSSEESIIENILAGPYSVTVEDNEGTTLSATVVISQPDAPMYGTINTDNIICNGGSDGQAITSVAGGTSPYTYAWSNDSTTQNLLNVPAGNYSVTITDQNNCQYIMSSQISEPEPFYIQSMDDPLICYGMYTEIGIGIITGGVPPYVIAWSNNDYGMTTIVDPIETTAYTTEIIDANNCHSEEIEITVNVLPEIEIVEISPNITTICEGDSVSINLDIIGSSGSPYTIICGSNTFEELPYIFYPEETGWSFFTVFDNCDFLSATDSVHITVNPSPSQYSCFQLPVNGILHQDQLGQISLTYSEVGVVYYIELNDQVITEEIEGTGSSIDFGSNFTAGTYKIMSRKLSCGCELVQGVVIFTNYNSIDTNLETEIKIYPNPVKDIIILKGVPQNSVYKIYDIKGSIIEKGAIEANSIYINDYTSGTYVLGIENKKLLISKQKFVIE